MTIGSNIDSAADETHKKRLLFTNRIAETPVMLNPDLVFCYVSGAGTDSSENDCIVWARLKGRTENQLLRMPFKAECMFRRAV